MSKWVEVETTEIRRWLIEIEDDENETDAFDAIETELMTIEPQEFKVLGWPDEKERETIRRHISGMYVLEM